MNTQHIYKIVSIIVAVSIVSAICTMPIMAAHNNERIHDCKNGSNTFLIDGNPSVEASWCSDTHFIPNTYAHQANQNGTEIIHMNEDMFSEPNGLVQPILLHEIAHAQGYDHGDGGVVNTTGQSGFISADWRENGTLHPTTKDVVRNVDGYKLITTNEDILWMVNKLNNDPDSGITNLEMLTAVNEMNRNHEMVIVTDSYNQYGGQYPNQTFEGEFVFMIVDDDS
jgi:hypothetical protein